MMTHDLAPGQIAKSPITPTQRYRVTLFGLAGAFWVKSTLAAKMKSKPHKNSKPLPRLGSFNAQEFLDTAGVSRKVMEYNRNESIYSQGQPAETVMYVQKGDVKLSVVSGSGKEAVVAMFGPGDFFGEGCMAGQTLRMGTTTAATPSTVLVIQKRELLRVLPAEPEFTTVSSSICSRTTFALRKT